MVVAIIYDCFMFYDEYDTLEMRMGIIDKYIDRFVIVQANRTFTGTAKPLMGFDDPRFDRFRNKIIVANVDATAYNGPWLFDYEVWLRNKTMDALEQCGIKDSDTVLLGDLDEIPNPVQLERYLEIVSQISPNVVVPLVMKYYNYYINYQVFLDGVPFLWTRTRLFKYGLCDYIEKQYLKNPWTIPKEENYGSIGGFCRIRHNLLPWEKNGGVQEGSFIPKLSGWHFSNLGGAEKIQQKFLTGDNHILDIKSINERMHTQKMLFDDEFNRQVIPVKIDDTYPKYILDNIDRLKSFIGPPFNGI